MHQLTPNHKTPCTNNPLCIPGRENEPLLQNIRKGLIDPDTPKSAMTRKGANGKTQNLVFSDEFNVAGRTFYDGDDPFFQAVDIWYGATQDLEVRTLDHALGSVLIIRSGTTRTQSLPRMARSTSNLLLSLITVSTIALA